MMFSYPGLSVPQMPMMPQLGLQGMPPPGKIPVAPSTTLWMGDIDSYMDENFVYSLYSHTGALTNVKIMRDKTTGQPSGFAFVTFNSVEAAQKVLENFNGAPIPGTNRVFRLNFAAHGIGKKAITENRLAGVPLQGVIGGFAQATSQVGQPGSADALFVGDLSPDVTEAYMLQTFQYYFPTAYSARIVSDPTTGASKGYGFIHFHDEAEKQRALTQMQGYYLSYRPIRLNVATKKEKLPLPGQPRVPPASAYQPPVQFLGRNPIQLGHLGAPAAVAAAVIPRQPRPSAYPPGQSGENDPTNVTVFVGGIEPACTIELLRGCFEKFGEISNIKIPPGKGCGFVEYVSHDGALNCIKQTGGSAIVGNATVRLGWGRPGTSAPKVPAVNLNPPNLTDASSANGVGSEFRNGGQPGGE
eukprot:TRINITY_DN3877_c0_g2_i2.p1 TRINITY_DN3877_c0_g2~~TRINITY_DN3877_c0_g2_i2.p1  ORF type:complete len:414 (+),score=88.27 TRINITY_DN3877_c0_g2_i2:145-1386(+)